MCPPPTEARPPTRGQRGAALIMAILAVALVSSTAMLLLAQVDRWIDRVALAQDKRQGQALARVGIDLARLVLALDARRSGIDTLEEDWARALPPVRQEGSEVAGQIEDLQGRFNLNQLRRPDGRIDEPALAALRRLLAQQALPPELADTLADWLDADDSPRAGGAEAPSAPARPRPANQPLAHSASLLHVPGFDTAVLQRLQAHIVVLPGRPPVNLNTASAEVLAAVQPGLSLGGARELVRSRQGAPFTDLANFRERLPERDLPAPLVPVGLASQYFLLRIDVQSERSASRASAMLERIGDGSRSRLHWMTLS